MKLLISLILLYLFKTAKCQKSESAPVVKTKVGEIIGTTKDVNVYGKQMKVNRFFGIPYAEPPIDDLRFKKPVPKKAFTSPFKALEHGKACLQMMLSPMSDQKEIPAGEDCLFLNLYVPAVNQGKLAVMVWIHGGGFFCGSADPFISDTLAAYGDVIVVTINYRLSIWGFLSTSDAHAPGNYGLWDQHLALKWVHDNIEEFGGDPERITIFGESAGAESVVYQSLYEGNKGSFQRVVAQSGSITAMCATCENPKADAEQLGKLVGCEFTDSEALINCLKSKSPDILNTTLNDFENGLLGVRIPFLPTVDGEFVKEPPKKLLLADSEISKGGRDVLASLDFMSGINAEEGLSAISPVVGIEEPDNFEPNRTLFEEELIPMILPYELGEEVPDIVKDLIIHEYTDWKEPENSEKRRTKLVALYSDILFSLTHIETVERHRSLAKDTKSTYMYLFDILPSARALPAPSWARRANHGDDLVYTFFEETDGFMTYLQGNENFQPTELDRESAKYIMSVLSNFAKTG